MRILSALLILFSLLSVNPPAQAENDNFVVMELFTTRGCVNCPPVDARMKKIVDESDQNLIALGCHVTYFNVPSSIPANTDANAEPTYNDPLAKAFCDARQSAYIDARAINKLGAPQIIINGHFASQGGAEKTILSGLKMAQSLEPLKNITLNLSENAIDITLPQMQIERPVDVWLFAYNENHSMDGAAGLAPDEPIHYVNYVSDLTKLLRWDGAQKNMSFPLDDMPAEGYAVIAQYADYTNIIAAGKIERP